MKSSEYKLQFNELFVELITDIQNYIDTIECEAIIFKNPIIQNTLEDTDVNGKVIIYGNIQIRGIKKNGRLISQGTGKMDDIYDESMEVAKSNLSDVILLVEILEILESKAYKIEA